MEWNEKKISSAKTISHAQSMMLETEPFFSRNKNILLGVLSPIREKIDKF